MELWLLLRSIVAAFMSCPSLLISVFIYIIFLAPFDSIWYSTLLVESVNIDYTLLL